MRHGMMLRCQVTLSDMERELKAEMPQAFLDPRQPFWGRGWEHDLFRRPRRREAAEDEED